MERIALLQAAAPLTALTLSPKNWQAAPPPPGWTMSRPPSMLPSAAFPAWSKTGPGLRRKLLMKAADIMDSKVGEFTQLMTEETGATAPWAGFNVMLAANILREAASMTTQISGEIIPSDKPGTLAMGVRQAAGVCLGDRALERAGHSGHPCHRHADCLRQHGHPQGI